MDPIRKAKSILDEARKILDENNEIEINPVIDDKYGEDDGQLHGEEADPLFSEGELEEADSILDGPGALDASKLSNNATKAMPPQDDPKKNAIKGEKLSEDDELAEDDASLFEGDDSDDDEDDSDDSKESDSKSDDDKDDKKDVKESRSFKVVPAKDSAKGERWNVVMTIKEANGDSKSTVVASAADPFLAKTKLQSIKSSYISEDKKAAKKAVQLESSAIADLFKGTTLTEDFRTKAATLFEETLNARTAEIRLELDEQYKTSIEEAKTEIVANLDKYLNYIAEEWMKENKLAVDKGLQTEIAESFLTGLKNLFAENYVEIPESKRDLLEEVVAKAEELEEACAKEINRNMELNEELEGLRRAKIVSELSEGLSVNDKDKLQTLSENVSFTDSKEFTAKVSVLKEQYITKATKAPAKKAFITEVATETTKAGDSLVEQFATSLNGIKVNK